MEKRVVPILLIVVLITVLFSTYAWFSTETASKAKLSLESGVATGLTLATNAGDDNPNVFTPDEYGGTNYQGQLGFKTDQFDANGNNLPYDADDAEYAFTVRANIEFDLRSAANCTLKLEFSRVLIELGPYFPYLPNDALSTIFNIQSDFNNYIATDVDNIPTTMLKGIVVDVDDKVTHVFITGEDILDFFEFDYWASDSRTNAGTEEKGVIRNSSDYSSAVLNNGINAIYANEPTNQSTFTGTLIASKAGTKNYMKVFIGFYGKNANGVYCLPFAFSDTSYMDAKFRFFFTARVD